MSCVFLVADVRYERIAPTLDAAAINDATELRFVVPASPDYFTRCKKLFLGEKNDSAGCVNLQ